MPSPELLQHLSSWIESTYHQSESIPNPHCFRLFRSVPLPDGATVSLVSVRHLTAREAQGPDHFVLELWDLRPGPILSTDVKDLCLALATFRAWYAEILEEAEVGGLRRRHHFSVHGNLVGATVEPATATDLLSHHGRDVAFWIYRTGDGGVEFEPHYGEGHPNSGSVLVPMLDHLSWDAIASPDSEPQGSNSDVLPRMG